MPAWAVHPARDLREAVRRYLQEHPDAADTLVGIRQWWLPESLRSTSMELIRLALAELVATGEMRCDALPDGTRLYSRAAPMKSSDSNGDAPTGDPS